LAVLEFGFGKWDLEFGGGLSPVSFATLVVLVTADIAVFLS
jgi:hypothetical protein